MKKTIFIIFLMLVVTTVKSQTGIYNYSGTIGTSPITLTIKYKMSKNGSIATYTGTYYYDKYQKDIDLYGTYNACSQGNMNPDTKTYITESVNGETTGEFTLYNLGDTKCSGTWSNGTKTIKVNLVKTN